MNCHVASRASPLILASRQAVSLSCFNEIIEQFPCSLRTLVFLQLKLLSDHIISLFAKTILFFFLLSFYSYNFYFADFARKLTNQAFL